MDIPVAIDVLPIVRSVAVFVHYQHHVVRTLNVYVYKYHRTFLFPNIVEVYYFAARLKGLSLFSNKPHILLLFLECCNFLQILFWEVETVTSSFL